MATTILETSKPALRLPVGPFRNEPATDFTNPENARRMREALAKVRAELGREAYELVGDKARNRVTLFDFPIHNYSGNWRQWVGNNWGVNFTFERQVNPFFNRNGATLGLFLDF